jgi:hypothetical protein
MNTGIEFFLPTGRHLSPQNDMEGYSFHASEQDSEKQDARSVKDMYMGIQNLKLTSLF